MSKSKRVTGTSLEFRFPMRVSMGSEGDTQEQIDQNMKVRWCDSVEAKMAEFAEQWLAENPEYNDVRLFHYNARIVFDLGANVSELEAMEGTS